MRGVAFLFLILFAAAMIFEYVAVRRSWLKLPIVLIGGCVVNSLCFIVYSVATDTPFLQALVIGAFIGSLFTIMAMIAASYFNSQQTRAVSVSAEMQQLPNADTE